MENNIDKEFISFYNNIKDNNIFKNNYVLSEPDIINRMFMVEFKRKSNDITIYDIYNPANVFTYTGLAISYNETNNIELNVLTLYNGDFFMNDVKEILYPNKIYNEDNLLDQIIKIYKVIEYFDYLVTYNEGKKIIEWHDWKDWNDYNF
jgi:hypothetical protein